MALTLRKIAEEANGEIIGEADITITGINALGEASPGDISIFYDPRYKEEVEKTLASALIVARPVSFFKGSQVVVSNPMLAYAAVARLFAPSLPRFPGVSRNAFVHETSRIGENASIYPLVYVGDNAVIGRNVTLFPGVFVGNRAIIGDDTILYPNACVLQDCIIGSRVILHAGVVVGSDGFGYVREGSANVKIPQIGTVRIGDDCEIGANSCVDRAALGETVIERGVKTDNLVQVAHNVIIGEDSIIVAQTGISGSVKIGREVVIGGQVGIKDHLSIGDRAMIGSQSGLAKSISAGEVVSGTPAIPHRLWLKISGLIPRLPDIFNRIKALERKVEDLENRLRQGR